MSLQQEIEELFGRDPSELDRARALRAFHELMFFLNHGEVRAAEKSGGSWRTNHWVKKGILLGFRLGTLVDVSIDTHFRFFDKDTFPLRKLALQDGVRLVPGGSSIRDGSFVARGVVCMPPMYVNVGAYVDEGTMVDSHALIGSCAQIGKRVHVSAAVQIGGVLEPVGALPVIIEDDVFIGGHSGIFEGTIVSRSAVIGAGVILTGGTKVYDIVHEKTYCRSKDAPLVIPERAVVVSGNRALTTDWARGNGLSLAAPVIVKYRDEKTDASTALEESLR